MEQEQTQALQALNAKVDVLTAQMQALTAYLEDQQRRQREWDELKADLTPIALDAYQVAVEQLAEVEPHVQLEDLLALLKRLARNTRSIEGLLDQLESLSDLGRDAMPILNDAVLMSVQQLDSMERRGYFRLAREGLYVLDTVADNFGPEDVRQLGDNAVTILRTVKEMTQPEIMGMMRNLAGGLRQAEVDPSRLDTSALGLLRQLRNPETRRGLAIALGMLRAMGAEQ